MGMNRSLALRIDNSKRSMFEMVERYVGSRGVVFALAAIMGKKHGMKKPLPSKKHAKDKWTTLEYKEAHIVSAMISIATQDKLENINLRDVMNEVEEYASGGIEYLAILLEDEGIERLRRLLVLYLRGDAA